jgi:alpha-tubulin suppressor-like RCC1 family protein
LATPHLRHAPQQSSSTFNFLEITNHIGKVMRWKDVAVGNPHSHGISEDGTLWSWGTVWSHPERETAYKNSKPLNPAFFDPPAQIGVDTNWKNVFSGYGDYTFALKPDDSLWAWGNNHYGQFGDGTTNSSTIPVRIGSDNDWKQVSSSGCYTFGLKNDGSLWEWGTDFSFYPRQDKMAPTQCDLSSDWAEINLLGNIALGIKKDGSLWFIASGKRRFKDDGDKAFRVGRDTDWKTTDILWWRAMALKKDGSLWRVPLPSYYYSEQSIPAPLFGPKCLSHSTNWLAVSEFAALGADGSFIGWPYAQYEFEPPQDRYFYLNPSRRCPFVLNLAQGNKP